MFCVTVSEGIRLNAWKTNPIRSRLRIVSRRSLSPASSVSPSATVPDVGRSSPAATWRSVLLPDPDGPMMAVKVPRENPMLIPSSATTAPSPSPWTLRTSRRATAGAVTVEVTPAGWAAGGGDAVVGACMGGSSLRRKGDVRNVLHTAGPDAALPPGLPAAHAPRAGAATGGYPYPCAAPRARLESAEPDDSLDAIGGRS